MPVPSNDMVCRFIPGRSKDWSVEYGRPKPNAFKQKGGLSVWHLERLREQGVSLEDLRIGGLSGYGQAHHFAGDYEQAAHDAAQELDLPLRIQVEWRPEQATGEWVQWAYAHIQVEHGKFEDAVLVRFRQILAARSRFKVPPDRY
jgi:hypothetical protein